MHRDPSETSFWCRNSPVGWCSDSESRGTGFDSRLVQVIFGSLFRQRFLHHWTSEQRSLRDSAAKLLRIAPRAFLVLLKIEISMKTHTSIKEHAFYRNVLFPENTFKKCANLKSGFWTCFPTGNGITRLSLIRFGAILKNVYIIRRRAQL